jgi:hypothetical protein
LRRYISGNAFKIPSKASPATSPPAVHVVLHVDVVGRCWLIASKPELKVSLVSALETKI